MSDSPAPAPAAAPEAPSRQVLIQKLYLKDASLEVPQAPQVFAKAWQPQMDVNVNSNVSALGNDQYQVLLSVTVTAKLGGEVAFLAEVHQAGIFLVRGFPTDAERAAVLAGYCPGLVFPFAREAIADLVQKGGFPQVLLQPINFEGLYVEHLNKLKAEQAAAAGEPAAARAH
ncbi:MAG TPA: protein-export chaperone SecB [Nevskiaceae bacterium]|nr:protein-export chaperone SecB [Nevskiaceae bacterium]